ncbi:hypothetical protein GC177_05140, partial [bacterium]|nr:hypothetical protein [bacterium]
MDLHQLNHIAPPPNPVQAELAARGMDLTGFIRERDETWRQIREQLAQKPLLEHIRTLLENLGIHLGKTPDEPRDKLTGLYGALEPLMIETILAYAEGMALYGLLDTGNRALGLKPGHIMGLRQAATASCTRRMADALVEAIIVPAFKTHLAGLPEDTPETLQSFAHAIYTPTPDADQIELLRELEKPVQEAMTRCMRTMKTVVDITHALLGGDSTAENRYVYPMLQSMSIGERNFLGVLNASLNERLFTPAEKAYDPLHLLPWLLDGLIPPLETAAILQCPASVGDEHTTRSVLAHIHPHIQPDDEEERDSAIIRHGRQALLEARHIQQLQTDTAMSSSCTPAWAEQAETLLAERLL